MRFLSTIRISENTGQPRVRQRYMIGVKRQVPLE